MPIPDGITPEQLQALAGLDEGTVARLAGLEEKPAAELAEPAAET